MAVLERPLNISTLNVRGLGERRKQCQLRRIMHEKEIDVLAIQETKIESEERTDKMIKPWSNSFSVCVSHAVGCAGGCCIFLRNNVGIRIENVESCVSGRFIVCDFVYSGYSFRVLCIYAPTACLERNVFFEAIAVFLDCERHVILLGDFNCVCERVDRSGTSKWRDSSSQLIREVLEKHELVDVAHCSDSVNTLKFTHFQGASHARLDRIYVSGDLVPICKGYNVDYVSFSDHCLVSFLLGGRRSNFKKFSWDLWKLNAKLLCDEEYSVAVMEAFDKQKSNESLAWGDKWECIKEDSKLCALERAAIIARAERKSENELRSNLKRMMKLECEMPGAFIDDISRMKSKLEAIDKERYRGATVRARAEGLLAGERPTKRALSDEMRYAKKNSIVEILWQGQVTRDAENISRAFVEHYASLFSTAYPHAEKFKQVYLKLMPRLEDEVRCQLEEPVTLQEIETAIGDLKVGKAPGPDGLSAEFYKKFSAVVAPFLFLVFQDAFEKNVLPMSFTRTHTVLIPKSDDPAKLQSVTGYRPITLANVDYKIFMKVLARRLQKVVTSIVGPHQTCGIRGRSIQTNTHIARTVLQCCDMFQQKVAMLQIDFEKAFDRVCHEILFCILEHVNVGDVLLKGVRMAYKNCTTQLIINKDVTESISVESSVRQGCPASPLLFCIFLEPFCLKIINDTDVHGFRLHSREVKLLTYADDVAVFCVDEQSVAKAIVATKEFCQVTCSSVNWNKCCGFWHGEWPATPKVFHNISWSTTPARYLGVPLEYYQDSNEYWSEEVTCLREKANKWGGRALSVFARATVCNLFLLAKLWYVLQTIHCSRAHVQKIHRVFAVFVWGSVWERTSRSNLFRSVKQGGVGLCHVFLRQIVSRFLFLRDTEDPFLRTVMQTIFPSVLPEFVVSSSNRGPIRCKGFLKEVVDSFRFLSVRFSLDYLSTVSRKSLTKDLKDIVFPVPLYRSMYCKGSGQNVLSRVKKMVIPASVKTFFFKLHTNTLPVKTWMQEKGLYEVWSDTCFLCKKPETVEHVFTECWDAIFFWDVLQRTLKKELPVTPQGIRYLPVECCDGVPYDLIMAVGLHSIWRSRMAVRHADVHAQTVSRYFAQSMISMYDNATIQGLEMEWLPILEDLCTFDVYFKYFSQPKHGRRFLIYH